MRENHTDAAARLQVQKTAPHISQRTPSTKLQIAHLYCTKPHHAIIHRENANLDGDSASQNCPGQVLESCLSLRLPDRWFVTAGEMRPANRPLTAAGCLPTFAPCLKKGIEGSPLHRVTHWNRKHLLSDACISNTEAVLNRDPATCG